MEHLEMTITPTQEGVVFSFKGASLRMAPSMADDIGRAFIATANMALLMQHFKTWCMDKGDFTEADVQYLLDEFQKDRT